MNKLNMANKTVIVLLFYFQLLLPAPPHFPQALLGPGLTIQQGTLMQALLISTLSQIN